MTAVIRFVGWVLTQAWRWGYSRVRRIADWAYANWWWVAKKIGEGWTYYEIAQFIIRYYVG